MKLFKIRCSKIADIMGAMGATQIQKDRHAELLRRAKDAAAGALDAKNKPVQPLTPNMEAELLAITEKINNPELPQGAKTYCEKWLKEQLYGRRKQFSSRYTAKGNSCEKAAIDFAAEQLGWGMANKNTERRENDFIEGEIDILLLKAIADVKCSWDFDTFPLFEDQIPEYRYWCQGQGYMALWDRELYKLIYALMDAPEEMIEDAARKKAWELFRSSEIPLELYEEVKAFMSYSNVDPALRLKIYEFKYDNEFVLSVIERVKECRKYINDVLLKRPNVIAALSKQAPIVVPNNSNNTNSKQVLI